MGRIASVTGDRGWFDLPGRPGDRKLTEQMTGLTPLLLALRGTSVLDVGCAEGLIAMEMRAAGAAHVDGVEIVPGHVMVARMLAKKRGLDGITFTHDDANTFTPQRRYDIVLMLAVLHKLKNPTAACLRFAAVAENTVVVRLPPGSNGVIRDERSGWATHDVHAAMIDVAGFDVVDVEFDLRGPRGEWMCYYERRKA
jgi:SAM-dependent methyltransferase